MSLTLVPLFLAQSTSHPVYYIVYPLVQRNNPHSVQIAEVTLGMLIIAVVLFLTKANRAFRSAYTLACLFPLNLALFGFAIGAFKAFKTVGSSMFMGGKFVWPALAEISTILALGSFSTALLLAAATILWMTCPANRSRGTDNVE